MYWILENKLMAGALPSTPDLEGTKAKIGYLKNNNVSAIINLMEADERDKHGNPFFDYMPIANELGIDVLRFPIKDVSIPTIETMRSILDTINHLLENEKTVYIHCWGGIGRTGTVAGCFLIEHKMATNTEAVSMIQKLKQHSERLATRISPETVEQIRFVENWSGVSPIDIDGKN